MYWCANLINPYYTRSRTRNRYQMFKQKMYYFKKGKNPKTNNPFWIWWQLISNKLGHVYQSSLLLTTVYRCVGTKEKSCWTFVNVMSHSCLISDFSCSAVLDLWCIFVTNKIYIYIYIGKMSREQEDAFIE